MIRIENVFAYLYDPQRLRKAKKESNLPQAVLEFALFGMNLGVLSSVGVVVLVSDFSGGLHPGTAALNAAQAIWSLGVGALIILPLLGALSSVLTFFILTWGIIFSAKALGGSGSFTQNAFLISRIIFPLSFVALAAGLLSQLPIIGFLFPIGLAIGGIAVFLHVIRVSNDLSLDKSAIILLAAIILGNFLFSFS
jgi:hypothetical protein